MKNSVTFPLPDLFIFIEVFKKAMKKIKTKGIRFMKKSFIRRILNAALSCSLALSAAACSKNNEAQPKTIEDTEYITETQYNTSELLEIYNRKFELLNEKYGTDLRIAPFLLTEAELDELLTGYSNMTDEEFEEYFVNMKEESEAYKKEEAERSGVIVHTQADPYSIEDLIARGYKISFSTNMVKNTEPVYPHKTDVENEETEEDNTSELLEIYNRKFELLNEKYGTDFEIAVWSVTKAKLDELLTGYSQMTDEEFEEYFLDLKEKSDAYLKQQSELHGTYSKRSGCTFDDLLRMGAEITVYNAETDAVYTLTPSSSPSAE